MNVKEMDDFSKRASEVSKNMTEWEIADQLAYIGAFEQFLETIRPIIDKYDPDKPKKFIMNMKRLDET